MSKKEYLDEDAVVFDNPSYDEAIIGVSHDNRVIYDYDLMVQVLMNRDGMTADEAMEWIDYNAIRAISYSFGRDLPIIMTKIGEGN